MAGVDAKIRALVIALAAATSLVAVMPAHAFELFGWKFFEEEKDRSTVSDPVRYSLTFNSNAGELDDALREASALVQDEKEPVSGDLGVVIKARDDRERLLAALYENARYGALVKVKVDGVDIDDLPPVPTFSRDKPVPVTVEIDPGPEFTIGGVELNGDAAKFNPEDYDLTLGTPAKSTLVISATGRIVEDLEKEGRPLARMTQRDLTADHKTSRATVKIGAEGGPIADVGEVTVSGSKKTNADFIERWSRLEPGRRYSPEEVDDATERLRKLGIFSSVSITKAAQLDPDGRIPMAITVADGKQRYFGLGAQFSTLDGLGLQGYWGHRNLFGNAEGLKITGAVSGLGDQWDYRELDYLASIEFTKPAAITKYDTFTAKIIAEQDIPDTYRSTSLSGMASLSYELGKIDVLTGGVDLTWNESEDFYGTSQFLIFSLPLSWARDASDNKFDPTEGYRLKLTAIPSYEINRANYFTTVDATISGYQSLGSDDAVILAAKLAAGSLVGAPDLEDLPATRRFYLGGGGTVRGYSFQEITPRNADGEPLGGRSYGLLSLEARVKVTESIGVVPFIDVGTVSSETIPDFSDIRAGAGIGLRYATPFGPLRLDVALPLNRYEDGSRFGIYAGIGQAF